MTLDDVLIPLITSSFRPVNDTIAMSVGSDDDLIAYVMPDKLWTLRARRSGREGPRVYLTMQVPEIEAEYHDLLVLRQRAPFYGVLADGKLIRTSEPKHGFQAERGTLYRGDAAPIRRLVQL